MIDLGHQGTLKSDIFQTTYSNVVLLFIINLPLRYQHSTNLIRSDPFSKKPLTTDLCSVTILYHYKDLKRSIYQREVFFLLSPHIYTLGKWIYC